MKNILQQLVPFPREASLAEGRCRWEGTAVRRSQIRDCAPEGYRLAVSPEEILIEAAGECGFFRAGQTLRQLQMLTGATCPCLEIADEPALQVRGYMLDISRSKVPRMDHLFHLVDLLALFKYNQLQLYTEHAFAYEGHEEVWENASPMTPEEIRQLDAYCRERFIELVPNQNAFGHMDRWLRHERYHPLAESPDGFQHPISGWKPNGSVLFPGKKSIEFIDGLLDQLLPCFHSEWVHLGCDEPWELGQGRSAARVEIEGRHAVFREYLLGLHQLLSRRGKRLLFWSDELREDPARIRDFPADVIPVVWGYEAEHPFAEECKVYSECDYTYIIAPGDSSWNSHCGRLDNALGNIRKAGEAALRHGAAGMLLTSWGDNGHQQLFPVQLPGIILFSASAWNPMHAERLEVASALNRFVFQDSSDSLGAFWELLGKVDSMIPMKINPLNSSFAFDALFEAAQKVSHAFRGHSGDDLFPAFDLLEDCRKYLSRATPACGDAAWLIEESGLAMELTRAGLHRACAIVKGEKFSLKPFEGEELCIQYRRLWLNRSRPGGLEESAQILAGALG